MTRSVRLALSLLLLVASACTSTKDDGTSKPKGDGKQEPPVKIDTFEDQGTACISGAADQAHEVQVDFDTCLSSSCDDLQSASCTVEQSGTELTVHAKASVSRAQGQPCTEDCRRAQTTCKTGTLAAGTYTLVYAGQRSDIVVPLAEPACTKTP
jgi:hypothetical protein